MNNNSKIIIEYLKNITLTTLQKILKKKGISNVQKYKKIDIINLLIKNKITFENILLENILINIENSILRKKKTNKFLFIKSKIEERYYIENINVINNIIIFKVYNIINNKIEKKDNLLLSLSIELKDIKGYYLFLDENKDKEDNLYIKIYTDAKIPTFFKIENKKLIINKQYIIKKIYNNIRNIIINKKYKNQILKIHDLDKITDLSIKKIIYLPAQYKIAIECNKESNNIHIYSINDLIGKYKLEVENDTLIINIYNYFPILDKFNIDIENGQLKDKSKKLLMF